MTQEEKALLLKDLCARLPYDVMGSEIFDDKIWGLPELLLIVNVEEEKVECSDSLPYSIENFRPYLRTMSSMTEEEKEELLNLLFDKEAKYFYINGEGLIDGKTSSLMKEGLNYPAFCPINIALYTDWLNQKMFDYRGLIGKGLALKAPEDMYK